MGVYRGCSIFFAIMDTGNNTSAPETRYRRTSSEYGLAGAAAEVAASSLVFIVDTSLGVTTCPSIVLKPRTEKPVVNREKKNPTTMIESTFTASKFDPSLGAVGNMATPGTKNTDIQRANNPAPGLKNSKTASPEPARNTSASTIIENIATHPAIIDGKVMPFSLKSFRSKMSRVTKYSTPAISFFWKLESSDDVVVAVEPPR
mmetsp:Transcript_2442/g.3222  ORF Transcript_2442/g.3222 Transcript_2442/m.3222 type:complete len:203 (+) Transcript_2442:388-996(+)